MNGRSNEKECRAKVCAVIVAAGNSTRMGGINKQFLVLDNMPVIARCISSFQNNAQIDYIVAVARQEDIEKITEIKNQYGFSKLCAVVPGGTNRGESVLNGVKACPEDCTYIAVQDGARPLVTDKIITETINAAFEYGAAAPAVAVKDTVKLVDDNGFVVKTVDRGSLRFVQTPQVFQKSLYLEAAGKYLNERVTDDCMIAEAAGVKVFLTEGDYENIKITTKQDIELASLYLKGRRGND